MTTTLTIQFGGYQKPASIHNRAAARFGEVLREKLAGGVSLDFQLIGDILALGRKSGELPVMVESGELTCCYISTVRFTRWVPELGVIDLPFVVRDRSSVQRAFNLEHGAFGMFIKRRFAESSPFRLLGLWDNGFRHLSNKVRPIRSPEDCRGLKIRTQMSESHGAAFAALGFTPVPADVKEFVEQIGGSRFDAQDNPLTNIYNFGVHKFHRYITLSSHFFGASAMICNAAAYAAWPADVRGAVEEAAAEATAHQHALAAAEDAEILRKFDARDNDIVTLTAAERERFVGAVAPMLARYRARFDPALFGMLAGNAGS